MPREVVKFHGKPEEIILKWSTGREGQNDNGKYFMYTLADNRIVFASPTLNQKIQNLQPSKGEVLQVQLTAGNAWEVKRVDRRAGRPEIVARAAQQMAISNGDDKVREQLMTDLGQVTGNSEAVPTKVQYGIAFADFLILASDAVRTAERNSPTGSVRFDNRDVAAIATTMFIAADRSGFLTWSGAPQGGR